VKIVLVHGFNVSDRGRRTVDTLAPHLRDLGHEPDTDQADYGLHNIFWVRFWWRPTVKRIAKAIQGADAVVTHSNGANYTMKALELLPWDQANTKIIIHLSPALNRKVKIPAATRAMHVFYTSSDWAVRFSRLLFFHPWGAMGARGYAGTDPRVTNHKYDASVHGHSGWFKGDNPSPIINTMPASTAIPAGLKVTTQNASRRGFPNY
jgi:hypothetical protein